jgi:multidrug efflux pump subunit AcrA (membrane-fusion protein)
MNRQIAVAVFLICVLPGCRHGGGDDEEPTTTPRVPVRLGQVREGNIAVTVAVPGITLPLLKERVVAPVGGRVIALKALEGTSVRAGDPLVVLRTREAQTAIEGAQQMLRLATTERERAFARRALSLADSIQPKVYVRAGSDGVVATRSVTEGELVADQAELLTLVDLASVIFMADVPVGRLSALSLGQPAVIAFPQMGGGTFHAVVDGILPQADGESQSVNVRLRFTGLTEEQHRLLKSNLQGTASIILGIHRHVLLVDRSALLRDDESGQHAIVLMTPDSLSRTIPVTVGVQNDSSAEVAGDGIRAGAPVILQGNYALSDSTRVTAQEP